MNVNLLTLNSSAFLLALMQTAWSCQKCTTRNIHKTRPNG